MIRATMAEQNINGGGAPATAVDKTIKQRGIKHHGIKAKLELRRARTNTHRRALATATRSRRRCCRPRGRRTTNGGSRWNQAPRLSWLGAQGVGRARTSFAEMVEALRRRQTHDGAAAMATGKQRRRVEKNGDGEVLIERLRSKE